jgi:hypothetical protein
MDYGEPSSYLALKEGCDVVSSDGEKVGTVQHVLADEEEDVFDGIVIDTQLGPGGLHFVDAPQVSECFERAIQLSIPAAEVRDYPSRHRIPRSWRTTESRIPRASSRRSATAPGI